MAVGAPCPHLHIIDKSYSARIIAEKKEGTCEWCGAGGTSLWLCLYSGCMRIGCGEAHADHSSWHNNQFPSHCITLNLTNHRAWCYMCEMEVTASVKASLSIPPGQQQHLGGPISAPGVSLAQPITPGESSAEEEEEEDEEEGEDVKARGLVGLRNLGLTCYMNAALQALSNSMPLAHFMIECPAFLRTDRKTPGLARPFQRLMLEMWHRKRPSFVTPSVLYHGFKQLYPMFRGFTQQDSQEFLRYFMDQLHEELREPVHSSHEDEESEMEADDEDLSSASLSEREESQSEAEYETCDSGVSEQSSASSSQHRSKRKKRQHGVDVEAGMSHRSSNRITLDTRYPLTLPRNLILPDHDPSEFSDAVSDTTLLDTDSAGGLSSTASPQVHSSGTSGIGSSKPSMASLTSSYRGKGQANPLSNLGRRKKPPLYRSIISDVFDGTIVSSVQCLTCNTISSRKETFQDLSLPIPSSDQLSILQHSSVTQMQHQVGGGGNNSSSLHLAKASCDATTDGWLWWMWVWLRSWLWGPAVSLHHCLAAFFSADELKGDNMYSCEKCGKLRNGVKYSKVVHLPEVLIIHLKRFRHEYMFSSKISQYVSFPLHGLDLTPFLHKDCTSEVVTYDLYAVICHHGTAGGGHYTSYCQNWSNGRWYEFDDQYVTEVSPETVAKCEAYCLFYKKASMEMTARRQRTVELMQVASREPSLMQFYVSKQWVNKFNTFAEPGPIDNSDFLCPHGGVQPQKASYVEDLVMLLYQGVWEYLHQVFGGGPACTRLYECVTCRAELEALLHRQSSELDMFIRLHKMFQDEEHPSIVYAISMRWFRQWESFVRGREQEPPGPIDNSSICTSKIGQPMLKAGSDYAQISEEMWYFFYEIYGGGPELFVRYGSPPGAARRQERLDGTRQEGVKSEQLQASARSLSTENLPYKSNQGPAQVQNLANRQRTVSASEQVVQMMPTHSPKPSGRERGIQSPEGQPCSTQPMEEDEDKEEEASEAAATEASVTMHSPLPSRSQEEASTNSAAAPLLPDEIKGEAKKGQGQENSRE
ncbi:ubiquitin carboxyl-terminal hydrolase 20-like isoform X5 [Penaeus japonicus]|uniref:ubiquitin carboxyl-terminal hydrolase 20-like isoform X5 n=1 Tax=Penaeus japonicus TaxID=27405 RepID=UPI001C70FF38|nr:ubiquitin carboxyl-terminal hydrolase 20-like isoform X5 [Penaeus japonicus]